MLTIFITILSIGFSGGVAIVVAPSELAILTVFAALFVFAVVTAACARWWFHRSFPFKTRKMHVSLQIGIEGETDRPVGRLTREVWFRPRAQNPTFYERGQYMADYNIESEESILKKMEYSTKLSARHGFPRNIFSRNPEPESLKCTAEPSCFRPLRLRSRFPRGYLNTYKQFMITEALILPNDFDKQDEEYAIRIREPKKRMVVRVQFDRITRVHNLQYSVDFGMRIGKLVTVKPTVDDTATGQVFKYSIRNPTVGSVVRMRWSYIHPTWDVRRDEDDQTEVIIV